MKKMVIFFACLLFLVPTAWADWTGAVADRHISLNTGPYQLAQYVRITAGPEGNLYCVWRQGQTGQSYELYFGRSTDQGATWSSETVDVRINADDGQSVWQFADKPLGIATNSQGDVFIVWAEDLYDEPNDYQEVMLLKSTDEGVSWIHSNADFNISFDGPPYVDAYDPDIAVDNNDNLYVVWYQDTDIDSTEIHISISTDDGDNWSGTTSDRKISYYNSSDARRPHIAVAPNNDIYVVWDEREYPDTITSARIQYGKSTDGGATFNSETADLPISTHIRFTGDAIIGADPLGNMHVTWQASQSDSSPYRYSVFYSRTTDGGSTWSGLSGPQFVDFGPDDESSIHNHGMAITSGGCLAVVWQETPINYSYSEIWASYSTDGGLTWSGNDEPELISFPDIPTPRGGYRPDIVAGAGDTLHAVWNESAEPSGGNYYDIHYSKGDTLSFCGGGPGPTGRCCYNNNADCVDTTEVACTALGGNWNAGLNCIDDPCGGGECDYIVGDVNGSDTYNGLDITYGVNFFKYGSPEPQCDPDCPPCAGWHYCGDVNASCTYNGLDITYGVNYFKYGSPGPQPCADCPPIE